MRGARRNMMQAARRHLFDAGLAIFTHQNQAAGAVDGGIKLGAVGFGVNVSVGHEILAADLSGLDDSVTPEQATLGTLGNGGPPLDAINECVRGEFFGEDVVDKKIPEVADGFVATLDRGAMKNTRGPVHPVHEDPLSKRNGTNKR